MYKLFRKLEQGERIVIGGDPADGGTNYCAAQAYSMRHRDFPFVFHARMEATQFGHELYKMALYIKLATGEFPLIAPEKNTGGSTIYVLMQYNYPNLFRMPKSLLDPTAKDKEQGEIGFITTHTVRMMIIDELAVCLRQKGVKIYDLDTVKELMTFVVKATGKPEAANGCFDDLVMAAAIALKAAQVSPRTKSLSKEEMAAKMAAFPAIQRNDDGVPV